MTKLSDCQKLWNRMAELTNHLEDTADCLLMAKSAVFHEDMSGRGADNGLTHIARAVEFLAKSIDEVSDEWYALCKEGVTK